MMKKILFTLTVLLLTAAEAFSQGLPPGECGIKFTYDATGSQIKREYICNNTGGIMNRQGTTTEALGLVKDEKQPGEAAAGALGSALNQSNILTGALLGGATSLAMFHGMNYYSYMRSSLRGIVNCGSYTRMMGDYQRSLVRHKEFGGFITQKGKYYRAPAEFRHNFNVDFDPSWLSKTGVKDISEIAFTFHTHWEKPGLSVKVNSNYDYATTAQKNLGQYLNGVTSNGPSAGDYELSLSSGRAGILMDRNNVMYYYSRIPGSQVSGIITNNNILRYGAMYWPWFER